jgi:hypothetical protein
VEFDLSLFPILRNKPEFLSVLVLELESPEDLALELTVPYLAFGESASQLRLVHGFEFEDEFEFEDDF